MANTYTLPGVLLSGTHASRPAASAVADGTLYAETDTGQTYQSDGSSTWTAWGAASGSLEVKEADGTPDVTGVSLVIVSNGTLTDNGGGSVSITTGGGGGGGLTMPDVVQIAKNGNAAASITITAAASGHSLIMTTNSTTGQVTAPTCTHVTWTAVLQTNDGVGYFSLWVGIVAGGSSGTSITMTLPGAFNTVEVIEVTDALTPTLGANAVGSTGSITVTNPNTLVLSGTTAGRLIVFACFYDNTGLTGRMFTSLPGVGEYEGQASVVAVAYALSTSASLNSVFTAAGQALIAEVS